MRVKLRSNLIRSCTVGRINGGSLCLPDSEGDRVWANNQDIDVMLAMTQEEFCGRSAIISSDRSVNSFS